MARATPFDLVNQAVDKLHCVQAPDQDDEDRLLLMELAAKALTKAITLMKAAQDG